MKIYIIHYLGLCSVNLIRILDVIIYYKYEIIFNCVNCNPSGGTYTNKLNVFVINLLG